MENFEERKEPAADLGELRNAIQEYSTTIEKLKNTPSLNNYHKQFKRQQNSRYLMMKENILAKIQQLIPPGIGTDLNFNIYDFLSSISNKSEVCVPIIDTLLVTEKKQMFYITNNSNGIVLCTKSDQAYSKFIRCLNPRNNSTIPICIFKPVNGKKLLFETLGKLMEFFAETEDVEGLFQKFIFGTNDHLSLLRVHWKLNSIMKGYQIDNMEKIEIPRVHNARSRKHINKLAQRYSPEISEENLILNVKSNEALLSQAHKIIAAKEHRHAPRNFSVISDFSYKDANSNLMDEQFCLLDTEPCKSITPMTCLKTQLQSACYKPWDDSKEHSGFAMKDIDTEKYLVTGLNPRLAHVTEIKNMYPEVKSIAMELVYLLTKRFSKRKMVEITLDFIKEGQKWVVLGCDKIRFDEDPKSFKEIVLTQSSQVAEFFIPILNNAHKANEQISMKIKNIPTEKYEPLVVHQRSMSTKNTFIPIRKNFHEKLKDPLKTIDEKLDVFISRADKLAKKNSYALEKHKEEIIKSYATNYPMYAIGLKKEELKKQKLYETQNTMLSDSKLQISQNKSMHQSSKSSENIMLKSILKDYNSMMIHVRRVNLQKTRPIIDIYGGDTFWRSVQKLLYAKIKITERMKKIFMHSSKEIIIRMFTHGFACIANSNISLEFRRKVRIAHKNLHISSDDFNFLGRVFISTLKEKNVEDSDLEIILDNYNSFSSAIVDKEKIHKDS